MNPGLAAAPEPARIDLRSLVSLTVPVLMGYGPLGLAFGFLLVEAGAQWWLAPLMSVFVFAGAAQFLTVSLLAAGAPVIETTLACLVVNLRHVFYGVSVVDIIPKARLRRAYCAFALTDENYSILTSLPPDKARANALGICAVNHVYWVAASLAGALIRGATEMKIAGIEFSLTALFTVLAVEQYRKIRSKVYVAAAVASYGAVYWIAPKQVLFASICLATLFGLVYANLHAARAKESPSHAG
jgi:4-azaleucine resistance transporter AzlC